MNEKKNEPLKNLVHSNSRELTLKGKSLWKKIKKQGILIYILGSALLLTFLKELLPDTTLFFQDALINVGILVYFIFLVHSGIIFNLCVFSLIDRVEFISHHVDADDTISTTFSQRSRPFKNLSVIFMEKLRSSMGIILGVVWILSVRAVSSKSRTLQLTDSLNIIEFVLLRRIIHQIHHFLKDFFTVFPLDFLIYSLPELNDLLFKDMTSIFFLIASILLIFWVIYDKGWKVLIDPTMTEDREHGKDQLDWHERLALPLGLLIAFISIVVDQSSLQGHPTYLFQLGLMLGGLLFLLREPRTRPSIGLVVVTSLTLVGISYLLTLPFPPLPLLAMNVILGLLLTYLVIMPGIIPRRCGKYHKNYPLLTIKPNIFTYLGQPKLYMDTHGKTWNALATACNIDPFLPGFFALDVETMSLKERLRRLDLATIVFLAEFYLFLPFLTWLTLIHLPFLVLLLLTLACPLVILVAFDPLPNFIHQGMTLNLKTIYHRWKESVYFQYRVTYSRQLKGITELDLSCLKLTALPESIGDFSQLRRLELQGNRLVSLSESIGKLSNLRELNLENNQLISLPESLGQLQCLEHLNLEGNQLVSLPENIGNLSNLQEFNLQDNCLTSLPESFGRLQQLQVLWLQDNQLSALPESFGRLDNLQELDLQNNRLTDIPESIFRIITLRSLDLGRNAVVSLPESINNLSVLRELYLGENEMVSLPESLGQLQHLRVLWLQDNCLTSLPESLGQLQRLQVLWLQDNCLTSLPESLGQLYRLEHLDLGGNQLVSLPESLGQLINLQTLKVRDNCLTSLPESLGQLYRLEHLDLGGNQLVSLPESIIDLISIIWINLQGNPNLNLSPEQEQWLVFLEKRGCIVLDE